jgi:uncharacterized membrane protein YedE/YeeE
MNQSEILQAAIGGGLIGAGSGMLWLVQKRVAGISGIAAGILPPWCKDIQWRLWFIAGLILSGLLYTLTSDNSRPQIESSLLVVSVAGLLVGFGSRLAGGCTSGHGICGIARLSTRSIVATLSFMFAAGIVVFVKRHLL